MREIDDFMAGKMGGVPKSETILQKKKQICEMCTLKGIQVLYNFFPDHDMSHVLRKPVLCHMRTTKAQISQRIHTV